MLSDRSIKARLELVEGKNAQPPNIVLVPAGRKRFRVEVTMHMDAAQSSVVASPDKEHSHQWCVLDSNLKQVMVGEARHGVYVAKKDPYVSRTVMGSAENPDDFDIDLTSAKLKNGAPYTLVCRSYGVLATLGFVALHEPKKKKAARKKAAKKKKKSAGKARKRKAASKKTAKKGAKKTAARKRTAARKKSAARRPARKAGGKRASGK